MLDAYNKAVFDTFKHSLSLCIDNGKYMFYLKNKHIPKEISDIKLISFIATSKLEHSNTCAVEMSWSVHGFGNILYAFTMMDLHRQGLTLCCDRDGNLSDEAYSLWYGIDLNKNFTKKPISELDYCDFYMEFDAEELHISVEELKSRYKDSQFQDKPCCFNSSYTVAPDDGFELAIKNHKLSLIPDLANHLRKKGKSLFSRIHGDWYSEESIELHSLYENDFAKLKPFQHKSFSKIFC